MNIKETRSQVLKLATNELKNLGFSKAQKVAWKVIRLAIQLEETLGWTKARATALELIKVKVQLLDKTTITFKKKSGELTTREVTSVVGNYEFKGSTKKATPTTLLKFVDVAKKEAGNKFNIISFHTYQIAV